MRLLHNRFGLACKMYLNQTYVKFILFHVGNTKLLVVLMPCEFAVK